MAVEYWNQRSLLGERAGSQDLIASQLERRAVLRYVHDGQRIIEIGCGTGQLAIEMAQSHAVEVHAFDSSLGMIGEAGLALARTPIPETSTVILYREDVLTACFPTEFDLAVSVRCLVNLPDWPSQSRAIERILSWLRPGGLYLAVECSEEGLAGINDLRAMVDLPAIVPPFHNRYLRDLEMTQLGIALGDADIAWLSSVESVCSTYQLLSRVVNARLAADAGVEPQYDSPINRLALSLPNTGEIGQNRCWAWRRCQ